MSYFVIAADGQKYGPADVPTLNHWAQEGRVLVSSMLEDASTGARIPASSVSGIVFPINPTGGAGYSGTGYQQPNYQQVPGPYMNDDGSADISKVWVYSGLSFIPCCFFFPLIFGILAIVSASNAQKKGNPQGSKAMTVAICCLVGGLLFSIILRVVFAGLAAGLGRS